MIIHPQSWGGGEGEGSGHGQFHSAFQSLSSGAKVTLKCWQLS